MKQIPLTQGKFALVDDEDFKRISHFKWFATRIDHLWYAARNIRVKPGYGGQRQLKMHNAVTKPPTGLHWDHRDGNGLNNQKDNLRPATTSQNQSNQRKHTNNRSGFSKGEFARLNFPLVNHQTQKQTYA